MSAQAALRARAAIRVAHRATSLRNSLHPSPATSHLRRSVSTSTDSDVDGVGSPAKPSPKGLLARILAPAEDGSRNRILDALGYYSPESRALGVGNTLYAQALKRAEAAARAEGGAEDEFAPRFEMMAVHVYLTLRRLRAEKGSKYEAEVKTVMQCLFDVFWTDVRKRMIIEERGLKLIESGKWIKECEQMFFGMAVSFDEAWGDKGKMREVVAKNVTCLKKDPQRVERFCKYMVRERERLDAVTMKEVWDGVCWDDKYNPTVHQSI